ncbi:MAG: prolipoprotein diacylglyceryl transferase [Candidatus Adiutrix sp.]|jgi:phosphatidylglycerol:prolipoprotein diacylglycerol transferase|nr:prolipoprotein diacylglyceryl transferase [Candidatus Adiutrix sp.]
MFPVPFRLGPLSISFYGFMVAAGVLAALVLFSWTAARRNLKAARCRDFCFWMVLAGLLGSRIFYILFHWPEFAGQPAAMLAYWRGGLMFQGGVLAALVLSPIFLKRYALPFGPTADVMAPSLALGQAVGRLGCLGAGCCYGGPAGPDNPLALIFPPGSLAPAGLPLWPTQLMESAGLFILALTLFLIIRSRLRFFSRPGRLAALYLMSAGLLRLLVEFFRGDFRGAAIVAGLPPTSLTALAAAVSGLILLFWIGPARPSRPGG